MTLLSKSQWTSFTTMNRDELAAGSGSCAHEPTHTHTETWVENHVPESHSIKPLLVI